MSGFTLIEILVTISIIIILMAILLPTLAMVRQRAATTAAKQTIAQLEQCLATYRSADAAHRFPVPQSDFALALRPPTAGSTSLLMLLETMGLPALRTDALDDQSRLVDPWGSPYQYTLTRPSVTDPASLNRWNYDADLGRVRAWGKRWDDTAKAMTEGPLPFAYVYSFGRSASSTVAAEWIIHEDDH